MTAPLVRDTQVYAQPVATTASLLTQVAVAPHAGTVTAVRYVPTAARAGAATNNRTYTLYNRSTGAGTVAVATLQLVSGTDLSDNVAKALTLSTASGATTVASGDVLEFESAAVSTGLPDPGGLVVVTISRS